MFQSSGKVGINSTAPNATLDVNGSLTARGQFYLPSITAATKTVGSNSRDIQLAANAWNSASASAVTQNFQIEAVPVGNNTASTSANLEILFGYGSNSPVATGLSIASNGRINFASGQTFPGTGGITGVTATSPLTGGGTSGAVTVGLNTSALETTLNSVYGRLGAANTFSGTNTFNGPILGQSTSTSYAIEGNTVSSAGVMGYASGAGFGVEGVTATSTNNKAAVLGLNGGGSATYAYIMGFDDVSAGVWGDSKAGNSDYPIGVIGTADNTFAGYFLNNSSAATIYAENKGGGTTGLFKTLMATSPGGTCGIGGGGNLTCTGQIKSLVPTGQGTRQVEAYAMQSPENWMEDFGSGKLTGGHAVITIDPTFAETVSESAEYRVFLTAKGESKNLYVTNETANGFEVREAEGGTASIGFDYRIVAKRRGLESQRLTDVTEKFNSEMKAALLNPRSVASRLPTKQLSK